MIWQNIKKKDISRKKSFLKTNEIAILKAKTLLDKGKVVIFDGNFYWKSQIEDLLHKLDYPHYVFTLKVSLKTCIRRDKERARKHGKDAATAVYKKSTSFKYGIEIDTENKNPEETLREIISHLKRLRKI